MWVMKESINVGDELVARVWVTSTHFLPFPFRTLWVAEGNQNLTEVGLLNLWANEEDGRMPRINKHYSYIMRRPMCYLFKKGATTWTSK